MSQSIIIKNISVVDEKLNIDDRYDIYISDGIIKKVGIAQFVQLRLFNYLLYNNI